MASNTTPDDQLEWEQRLLVMPFLEEDLPFLANLDNRPWVAVEHVLEILEAEESNNSTTAIAEAAPRSMLDMSASTAPGASHANFAPIPTIIDSAPGMSTYSPPEVSLNEFLTKVPRPSTTIVPSAPAYAPAPSVTTAPAGAPDVGRSKKSCTFCAARKVKCEVIVGSNPRLCKSCQQKGLTCQFELKKAHAKAQS